MEDSIIIRAVTNIEWTVIVGLIVLLDEVFVVQIIFLRIWSRMRLRWECLTVLPGVLVEVLVFSSSITVEVRKFC